MLKGMVSGHRQCIDSASVKANASMDSLERKVPSQDLEAHLSEIRHISARDKEVFRKAKENKASKEQQIITASQKELDGIKSRNKKWSKDQDQRPGSGNKGSRYTSNNAFLSLCFRESTLVGGKTVPQILMLALVSNLVRHES